MAQYTLEIYQDPAGREPFSDWLYELRDVKARARIRNRLARIEELRAFGDCEPVGEGVFELRFFFGPGYRVYFGQIGERVILLLAGGDKASQVRDIARAKQSFNEYWQRQT
jgi:putative addiction module killer protein